MVGLIEIPTTSREKNRGRRSRTDQRVSKSRDRWSRHISARREIPTTQTGSRDPLRYTNAANTYQFVGSDPVRIVNPSEFSWWDLMFQPGISYGCMGMGGTIRSSAPPPTLSGSSLGWARNLGSLLAPAANYLLNTRIAAFKELDRNASYRLGDLPYSLIGQLTIGEFLVRALAAGPIHQTHPMRPRRRRSLFVGTARRIRPVAPSPHGGRAGPVQPDDSLERICLRSDTQKMLTTVQADRDGPCGAIFPSGARRRKGFVHVQSEPHRYPISLAARSGPLGNPHLVGRPFGAPLRDEPVSAIQFAGGCWAVIRDIYPSRVGDCVPQSVTARRWPRAIRPGDPRAAHARLGFDDTDIVP